MIRTRAARGRRSLRTRVRNGRIRVRNNGDNRFIVFIPRRRRRFRREDVVLRDGGEKTCSRQIPNSRVIVLGRGLPRIRRRRAFTGDIYATMMRRAHGAGG